MKPVALITKVIQEVDKKTESVDWKKATKGESLISGDEVRTGKKSLAIIKFLDNSILRVREQSSLKVNSEGTARTVEIENGGLGFDIQKQKQNEQFKFTSPTSVASIRGTKGKISHAGNGDILIVTEGTVNLKNNASGNDVDVTAGTIGFSNSDGTVSSRKATQQELADATSAATGGSNNELNLEMKDSKGNKKELKFKYKK